MSKPPALRDVELTEADVEAILDAANKPSVVVERLKAEPYQPQA